MNCVCRLGFGWKIAFILTRVVSRYSLLLELEDRRRVLGNLETLVLILALGFYLATGTKCVTSIFEDIRYMHSLFSYGRAHLGTDTKCMTSNKFNIRCIFYYSEIYEPTKMSPSINIPTNIPTYFPRGNPMVFERF